MNELRSVEAQGRVFECLGSLNDVYGISIGRVWGLESLETEDSKPC